MVYNLKSAGLIRACKSNDKKRVKEILAEDEHSRKAGFFSTLYTSGMDKALGDLLLPLDINYMERYEGELPLHTALKTGSDDLEIFELLLGRLDLKVNMVPFRYSFPKEIKLFYSPIIS